MIKRYLEQNIIKDLKEKMVFISGPRQVGKTTIAIEIGKQYYPKRYECLNWDNRQDRKNILNSIYQPEKKMLIFDEIHKYKKWKNYLKGEYDKNKEQYQYLVTGSARLNIYSKSGDSLLGRYHSYRLHPLSINEITGARNTNTPFKELYFTSSKKEDLEIMDSLLKFGGFPELFVKQNESELRRWHNNKIDRLIKEDIRDIESIRDLSGLQVLVELLPSKVGSLFSLNSLREDLSVTFKTTALWTEILEKFYYHFRIYPFQSTRIKSLRKEPKLYLWDWSEIEDENARFENMVACHLLKYTHFLFDSEGYKTQLYYLRDKEQHEVDFLICVKDQPWFSVEVKNSIKNIPSSLLYFKEKLKIPYNYIITKEKDVDFMKENIRFISAHKFLNSLV